MKIFNILDKKSNLIIPFSQAISINKLLNFILMKNLILNE